jgi:predicted metal-dependent phosphoesterase TrpH
MSLFFGKTIYNIILKFKHKNLHFLNRFGIKLKRFKLNSKIQLNKPLKITKKEISILIEFFWITLMLTQALQYIHFPTHSIKTELASDEFLFDFHVHTTHSDGTLTPARRVDWYIDQGIQGAAFSDHHNLDAAIIAQKYIEKKNLDFTVLQAQEFTDDPENIHLNIYGNTDQVIIPTNYRGEGDSPEKLTCQEAIQWAKSEGFFVIVNHYKEPTRAPFTYEQLMEWGVDGFEVINGGDERAPEIRQFCLDNNLICIAGSDIHSNEDINTFVKLKLEDPTNKSIDAIFQALKHNEHEAVLVEYFPNDAQTSFQVLDDYINYFLGLSQTQIFSWLSWIILIYIAAIFTIKSMKGNKKVVEKII